MKILKKGKLSDGTVVQMEDWSQDYSFKEYVSTIAAYPISKTGYSGAFEPKKGERVRMQYDFKSSEETKEVFAELIKGKRTLKDLEVNLYDKRYKDCI